MFDNDVINWLLEDNNPAIKYRTLTELFDRNHKDVEDIYEQIWEMKEVKKILSSLTSNGDFEDKHYGSQKYVRYFTALAELGLKKNSYFDLPVDNAVNLILKGVVKEGISGCGNALVFRALVMLDYYEHPKVKELIDLYIDTMLFDGGFNCKRLLDKKPDRKSCYKASLASLLLYAECKKKGIFLANTNNLCDYLLKRDIFFSSDKSDFLAKGKEGWRFIDNFFPVEAMRIGLPLIISALSVLGVRHNSQTNYAWNILNEKKNKNGRLALEGTFTKQPCSFGKVGEENKWITFYALLAEKEINS